MHEKAERVFRKILHWMEGIIAAITLVVMVFMVLQEIYRMFTVDAYFNDIHTYLHSFLNILVGLEFVRMLIDLTPGNTIEVLIVALARQVIINHEDPVSNVCCVLCIAGLFATRHFPVDSQKGNQPGNERTGPGGRCPGCVPAPLIFIKTAHPGGFLHKSVLARI